MATDDRLQTALLSTDAGAEMRTGGAILFIGAVVFVLTVGLELIIGWPPSGGEATEITAFILQYWSSLRWIWAAQMLGTFLIAMSALVILRSRHLAGLWRPATVIWSAVGVSAIVLTVAYGLTLGSYPPALQAIEGNPEIFATMRGGVRFLLESGLAVLGLGFSVLVIREGMAKGGIVPRSWTLGIVVAVVLAIMTAAAGFVQPQTAAAVVFFVPALLGLALWRAGRQLAP